MVQNNKYCNDGAKVNLTVVLYLEYTNILSLDEICQQVFTIEIIIKTRGLTPCGLLTAIEAAHANCRHIVRTAKANSKV